MNSIRKAFLPAVALMGLFVPQISLAYETKPLLHCYTDMQLGGYQLFVQGTSMPVSAIAVYAERGEYHIEYTLGLTPGKGPKFVETDRHFAVRTSSASDQDQVREIQVGRNSFVLEQRNKSTFQVGEVRRDYQPHTRGQIFLQAYGCQGDLTKLNKQF